MNQQLNNMENKCVESGPEAKCPTQLSIHEVVNSIAETMLVNHQILTDIGIVLNKELSNTLMPNQIIEPCNTLEPNTLEDKLQFIRYRNSEFAERLRLLQSQFNTLLNNGER